MPSSGTRDPAKGKRMSTATPIFFHRFCLDTSAGNRCIQPIAGMVEDGLIRWFDIPGEWRSPASESDLAEVRAWAGEAANESRHLMDDFRKQHAEHIK